jgi:hypothetical protein
VQAEVGKVTFKNNCDEVLCNKYLYKSYGDEAFSDDYL